MWKISLSDSNIVVQVDVYHERSSGEVLLVETNIDASGYVLHPNQKEVEDLVNQVASNYFVPLAQIPYNASEPDVAGQWVNTNLLNSYDDEPKEKTSTKIGPALLISMETLYSERWKWTLVLQINSKKGSECSNPISKHLGRI